MPDSEGRTSKLAAAIARSGQGIAPAGDGPTRRRAVPMNGTIRAGDAQPSAADRGGDGPANPPESLGLGPEQGTPQGPSARASSLQARTRQDAPRASHRRRAGWFYRRRALIVAAAVALVCVGAIWALRSGPTDPDGPAVPTAALSPRGASAPPAEAAQVAPVAPTPASGSAAPVPGPPETPVQAPPVAAGGLEGLHGSARPVVAVVPAGRVAQRLAPLAVNAPEFAQGLPLAPRAQPVVVLGTAPTGTAPPRSDLPESDLPGNAPAGPEPPRRADALSEPAPSELPAASAAFDAPHNIILHYNPATPGAADEASRLAAALRASGALSVTVATVPFTISATHLRQYHQADAPLARAVSGQAETGIEVRDFTGYTPRPSPGLIEVWFASG